MTYFHTCKTCAFAKSDCAIREKLKASIAGLGISSVKHRCGLYAPLYAPGAPVLVQTVAWMSRDGTGDEEGPPPIHWYPGHFIRFVKSSVVAFVRPGADSVDGHYPYPFETSGSGFVKVPLARVRPSDWADPVDTTECRQCGSMTSLGQPCGLDPHYGSLAKCLKEQRPALSQQGGAK